VLGLVVLVARLREGCSHTKCATFNGLKLKINTIDLSREIALLASKADGIQKKH